MRVGLDLLYLLPGETGGRETYARELIPAMLAQDHELELIAFLNRDTDPALARELGAGVRTVTLALSPRSRWQWAAGELALISLAAQRSRVQVLHSMANFGPPLGPFRRVLTLHDLHYRALPELLSWPVRSASSLLVSLAARRATRIIAVSGAGAREIQAGLGIDPQRIDVVANGLAEPPPPPPTAALRERLGAAGRSIALCVASNLPHKNLSALIDALALIDPARRPLLVMLGHASDAPELLERARAAGVAEQVRLLGARPEQEREALYALADCLVLASLHEGFGLPVLEAMARSLPVACSDIPALREVAGPAALYFDPRSPVQIAARIEELIGDRALADRLRALGVERAAHFSWQKAAQGTLASYRAALGA